MFNFPKSIAVRKAQGSQFIPDLRAAVPGGFRGKPVIAAACVTPAMPRSAAPPTSYSGTRK
mgnify:CR=1 FL=1